KATATPCERGCSIKFIEQSPFKCHSDCLYTNSKGYTNPPVTLITPFFGFRLQFVRNANITCRKSPDRLTFRRLLPRSVPRRTQCDYVRRSCPMRKFSATSALLLTVASIAWITDAQGCRRRYSCAPSPCVVVSPCPPAYHVPYGIVHYGPIVPPPCVI